MVMEKDLLKEIEEQKKIAFTAGLLFGDVTIKTLIESLAEGVVVVNESGRIIIINERMSKLTKYEKDEIMGQPLDVLIPGRFAVAHHGHFKNFLLHPKIRPMGNDLELFARRKDNSEFPIEISLSSLVTNGQRLSFAFVTDVTLRKKAEDELKRRNEELDAFAHSVAHDLNSSVSGMVNFSELLLDDEQSISKEERREYLKEIADSGRKMNSVIQEMLMFASMKKEEVELVPLKMQEIIDSALNRLKFVIKDKAARVTQDNEICDCLGYGPWVEEIWYNYLSNALKYGGNKPEIHIGCTKSGDDYIEYFVSDKGEGMSKEQAAQVFNLKEPGKTIEGHGIGLAIVQRIIEKLDGCADVKSAPGEGSRFGFVLRKEEETSS